jgi:hypothetical protein
MTAKLSELSLRHVDPSRLLFQQRHPAFPRDAPEWYEKANRGGIAFAPWLGGTVLATMEAKAERDAYFVVVGVMGYYTSDAQQTAMDEKSITGVDNSTLAEASEDEMRLFSERVIDDLYPFLRAELYELSGRLQGVVGVMFQPHPLLGRPRDAVAIKATELGYTTSRNISTSTDTYERDNRRVSVRYTSEGMVAEVQVDEPETFPPTLEGALAALQAGED